MLETLLEATAPAGVACPICNENFHDINLSDAVCEHHQGWIVTVCRVCGRTSFSMTPGICPWDYGALDGFYGPETESY